MPDESSSSNESAFSRPTRLNVMNKRDNFSILTLIAIGACLALPTFAELVDRKIYIVRRYKSDTEKDLVISVGVARNEEGEEVSTGIYAILPAQWEPLLRRHIPPNVPVEEIPLGDVPVVDLIKIVQYHPELYSPALPSLLAKTTSKKIVEALPVHRLSELTPEARAKIAPERLEELEKLYENMETTLSPVEPRT